MKFINKYAKGNYITVINQNNMFKNIKVLEPHVLAGPAVGMFFLSLGHKCQK